MGKEEHFRDLEETRIEIVQIEDSQMENPEVEGSHHMEGPQLNVSHGQELQMDISRDEEDEDHFRGEEDEAQSGDPQQTEQVLFGI